MLFNAATLNATPLVKGNTNMLIVEGLAEYGDRLEIDDQRTTTNRCKRILSRHCDDSGIRKHYQLFFHLVLFGIIAEHRYSKKGYQLIYDLTFYFASKIINSIRNFALLLTAT